ncbi:hypothetical protein D6825_03775 [Candidatus Woesearchaeota archaeon]|nr:MAG: hypothetical protein D6825_03775 [Candidatus Woesearchaeota archaeon]
MKLLKVLIFELRNFATIVASILSIAFYQPSNLPFVARGLAGWWRSYSWSQKQARKKHHYVVYTKEDHAVPFVPDAVERYALLPPIAAKVLGKLARTLDPSSFRKVVSAFLDLGNSVIPAYMNFPVRMPRFTSHGHLSLRLIQLLDEPYNCVPSLHIAGSLLLYNICNSASAIRDGAKDLLGEVRSLAQDMFAAVLYTKQHAYADVAFGILAAKRAFSRRFKSASFDDLISDTSSLEARHPKVKFRRIRVIYGKVADLYSRRKSLTRTVGDFLKSYPKIPGSHPDSFYDSKKRSIVPIRAGSSGYS